MLDDGRITIGLIVNGIHVCPALVRQVWRLTAGRLNLVRDAMAALGMPDGLYQLGDFALTGGNGRARLADGTLAGSILPLDQAVRHLMAYAACDFAATVDAAMVRPCACFCSFWTVGYDYLTAIVATYVLWRLDQFHRRKLVQSDLVTVRK